MPTRRHFLQLAAGASVAAALRPASGLAQTTLPRLQAGDMAYQGYFTVPQGTGPTFSYGGMGLAMGPDGDSLYYGGLVSQQVLGRISIPAIGGTASIITQPTSIPGSHRRTKQPRSWPGRLLEQPADCHEAELLRTLAPHTALSRLGAPASAGSVRCNPDWGCRLRSLWRAIWGSSRRSGGLPSAPRASSAIPACRSSRSAATDQVCSRSIPIPWMGLAR